jgi:hypothetical protein
MNMLPLSSGLKYRLSKKPAEDQLSLPPPTAGFFFRLLFDPDDEGNVFLRNAGLSPNYTVLHPT